MNRPQLVTYKDLTLDVSQIKCLKVLPVSGEKTFVLSIEFKTRYEGYIKSPVTDQYEKLEFNDSTNLEFRSQEAARERLEEWEGIWRDYLSQYAGSSYLQ